eukprot:Seg6554.2 transcript_id=Seg6554.2/GoldUCD/mRNA.D3Y31 product="hypothetical protein" protein_id=Seg6554.2/GoldUCD/D3Y31
MGGTAAQCWFDEEMSTIKSLADLNKKDSTSLKVLKKSKAEPFPEKLVSDPGCKAKLIKIEVMDDVSDDIGQKGFIADTEESGDPENSDVTSGNSGDEEIETSGEEWGAEHIQSEKAPNSDVVKERDSLKKRVRELERKVERLENETQSLADEKEMLKRAYKSERREREYLEELLDKLDEENEAEKAGKKAKKRGHQNRKRKLRNPQVK